MPHVSRRRILHFREEWHRSVRPERRLYNVTGDIADLWRARWDLDRGGMDGAEEINSGGGVIGGWAGKGNFDG